MSRVYLSCWDLVSVAQAKAVLFGARCAVRTSTASPSIRRTARRCVGKERDGARGSVPLLPLYTHVTGLSSLGFGFD